MNIKNIGMVWLGFEKYLSSKVKMPPKKTETDLLKECGFDSLSLVVSFSDQKKRNNMLRELLQSSHIRKRLEELGLRPAKTEVRPSSISGNGLFTKDHIPNYKLITLYPAHGLRHSIDGPLCEISISDSYADAYGGHDIANDHFLELHKANWFDPYKLTLNQEMNIYGDPALHSDPWYRAHMVNDAAAILVRERSAIEAYLKNSIDNANCAFIPYGTFHALVAIRNIEAGEELLTSYGASYWLSRNN
jgi:hypothetical protein